MANHIIEISYKDGTVATWWVHEEDTVMAAEAALIDALGQPHSIRT